MAQMTGQGTFGSEFFLNPCTTLRFRGRYSRIRSPPSDTAATSLHTHGLPSEELPAGCEVLT